MRHVTLVDIRPSAARIIQSGDVFVDINGVMAVTDTNAGLYMLHYEGRRYDGKVRAPGAPHVDH